MHWFNFPILSVMIWSGLRIYWAFDVSRGRFDEDRLIPQGVYETLNLDRKLARGLAFHFSIGWLFVINGLLYVGYLAFSREWKQLIPNWSALKNVPAQMMHEMGMRKDAPPRGQYNVMQQLAYSAVIVMGAIVVATGFAIYKPTQLSWLTTIFGGYETARTIHFVMTVSFTGFFIIHIVQVVRAGFANFWSMITGYELEEITDAPEELIESEVADV
ncbi:MAG: thiosulfate reductase cytochrome b subunit [Verrucomicrobiales bacterium]|jgi:thiosulfate reductase cytochrome b subunit